MKYRFDLIIFDWDGTLIDSVEWIVHCIQQAAARHNCPVPTPEAARDIIGLSIENAMKRLFPDIDDLASRQLVADYGQNFLSRQMSRDDLFPGVYEMLRNLNAQGFRLAIATGKKSAALDHAVNATGVADFFSTRRCADQTASKPHPLMIDQIVSELGIDKQRTLMVGDSSHDLQMAINAGVASIGVTCGAHPAAVLNKYQPLMCLNYPTELLEFF
ncbi:MAG: HAD-IIIA family hydrolase [Methylomonas sp.]|jgi:phosphoglycolate phosphatase